MAAASGTFPGDVLDGAVELPTMQRPASVASQPTAQSSDSDSEEDVPLAHRRVSLAGRQAACSEGTRRRATGRRPDHALAGACRESKGQTACTASCGVVAPWTSRAIVTPACAAPAPPLPQPPRPRLPRSLSPESRRSRAGSRSAGRMPSASRRDPRPHGPKSRGRANPKAVPARLTLPATARRCGWILAGRRCQQGRSGPLRLPA